jgi:hypothetical protein
LSKVIGSSLVRGLSHADRRSSSAICCATRSGGAIQLTATDLDALRRVEAAIRRAVNVPVNTVGKASPTRTGGAVTYVWYLTATDAEPGPTEPAPSRVDAEPAMALPGLEVAR